MSPSFWLLVAANDLDLAMLVGTTGPCHRFAWGCKMRVVGILCPLLCGLEVLVDENVPLCGPTILFLHRLHAFSTPQSDGPSEATMPCEQFQESELPYCSMPCFLCGLLFLVHRLGRQCLNLFRIGLARTGATPLFLVSFSTPFSPILRAVLVLMVPNLEGHLFTIFVVEGRWGVWPWFRAVSVENKRGREKQQWPWKHISPYKWYWPWKHPNGRENAKWPWKRANGRENAKWPWKWKPRHFFYQVFCLFMFCHT